MELNNEFEVDRPVDETWDVLTDVERIAPCLPGAQLQEIEGEGADTEYRGIVKVKVGPITAQYKGKATFVEKDDAAHKAVIKAEGRDSRGQGNASAMITAQLSEITPSRTKVVVNTDLTVTGKVAQFGRGVMAEVSEKILTQFVQNLETRVLSQQTAPSAPAAAPGGAALASPPPPPPAATTGRGSNGSAPAEDAPTTEAADAPEPPAAETPATPATHSADESTPKVRKIESTEPVEPVNLLGATGGSLAKRLAPVGGVLAVAFVLLRLRSRRKRRRSLKASLLDQGASLLSQGLSEGGALLSQGLDQGGALLNEGTKQLRKGRRRLRRH